MRQPAAGMWFVLRNARRADAPPLAWTAISPPHDPNTRPRQQRKQHKDQRERCQVGSRIVGPASHGSSSRKSRRRSDGCTVHPSLRRRDNLTLRQNLLVCFRNRIACRIKPFIFEHDAFLVLHRKVGGQRHDRIGHRDTTVTPQFVST